MEIKSIKGCGFMKKFLFLLLLPSVAMADESPKDNKFNLNIRRIGLDWTKTTKMVLLR